MAKVLNLPTELHCMFLASQCSSYIRIRSVFGRHLGSLHSSGNNRMIRSYSHISRRRVIKVLLDSIEKRLNSRNPTV